MATLLPPLNDAGDLPAGVHRAGWEEVELRFGKGTGELRRFYVFGSFVSAVPAPRDVDVVLVMDRSFRVERCPRESLTLFSHADAQARYGASVFWLREGMLDAAGMRDFLRAWQVRRDGTFRGILEVA